MAAGLGFKDFVTGEVLTAADVDGYLMQGVWVFASAAARDAAVTSPQEGNFAYLKDTNVTTYYTGSAWANLDTTGMTNPMTTTGDIIYSSPGSTPVRLGIGSTGNVLTVASGVPSWAAPAGGGAGLTLISTTTIGTTVSSITVSSAFSATFENYLITINGGVASESNTLDLQLGSTTTGYYYFGYYGNASSSSLAGDNGNNVSKYRFVALGDTSNLSGEFILQNPNLAKRTTIYAIGTRTGTGGMTTTSGSETSTTQHTAFTLSASSGTVTGGTIRVYGYSNS
jgi:hypothetical protein